MTLLRGNHGGEKTIAKDVQLLVGERGGKKKLTNQLSQKRRQKKSTDYALAGMCGKWMQKGGKKTISAYRENQKKGGG